MKKNKAPADSNFFSVHQSKWKIRQQFVLQLNSVHTVRVIALWMHFILQNLQQFVLSLFALWTRRRNPLTLHQFSVWLMSIGCSTQSSPYLYHSLGLVSAFSAVFSLRNQGQTPVLHHFQIYCQFIHVDHFQLCLKSSQEIKHKKSDKILTTSSLFYFWNVFETVTNYNFEVSVN